MQTFSNLPLRLLALVALTSIATAQSLVVPDNTNLGFVSSTTFAWKTTAGRFQIAYDSTHFTNAGVTGPIQVNRLRFRARDGEPNLGGQVYTGVSVEVGNCAVDYASLSATFATNRGTMGPAGIANVTVAPATATVPNDYVVDIDLAAIGASFLYDPSTGTDFLIDITFAAPTGGTNLVPFSAGSGTVATARARMCNGAAASATGGLAAPPPLVLIDFVGGGGYAAPEASRLERYGHGCGATFRSFYQDWRLSEPFDLANTSITMVPDNVAAPTGYTVTLGATAPDLTKLDVTPDSIANNALVTHALGFTFNYVSGSTTTIKPCTEGYVWLDSAMTLVDTTVAVSDLLSRGGTNYTARLAPCWYNFDPSKNTTSHPNAGLHVITDTSGGPGNAVCYVTWYKVGRGDVTGAGHAVSDFQVVLYEATGVMEMRFGAMQVGTNQLAVTGWSPGKVATVESQHPGPLDLSHELLVPYVLAADVNGISAVTHDTLNQARPIIGTTITPQAFNLPAGMLLYMLVIDVAPPIQPAFPLPGILAPGCGLSVAPTFWIYDQIVLPPAGTWSALPLLIVPTWATMGLEFYTQVAAVDLAIANILTTNALKFTVGLN